MYSAFCSLPVRKIIVAFNLQHSSCNKSKHEKYLYKEHAEILVLHCTRVKGDSGLSYDQLGGHRGVTVVSVEQLGDLQQPAGLIRPVKEAVD